MSTSRAPKNKPLAHHPTTDWSPSGSIEALRQRANWLARIRAFFAKRDVLEVETPVLAAAGVTDIHIDSLREASTGRWLQTSPEYAMKRLLAVGLGDCYQITRAFRAGEQGSWHNPEFTLLEWYRLGFNADALMAEVADLVAMVLGPAPIRTLTYAEVFTAAGLPDPITASDADIRQAAKRLPQVQPLPLGLDRNGLLDWLLSQVVVPSLPERCFITHFPASQAVLARLSPDDPRTAERFELFCDGIEIANGFHELTDAKELRNRFTRDQSARAQSGERVPEIDERLLAALESGLPDCAGVALGVDRVIALALGSKDIASVMAFSWDRA